MADQESLSGKTFGNRYELREQLGGGGMADVYKAWDIRLERYVAIKVMRPRRPLSTADLQQFTRMFEVEAKNLAKLKHANIPGIYDSFEEAEQWFLVMEFIEGETLEKHLEQRGGSLPIKDALHIGIQLATVLEYLHTRQPPMIFRDLKPSNVMITPDGQVYLIDFGIVRLFKPGQAKDTDIFISKGYAAPEQYGTAQTSERSDIYSLGATLHRMLSGTDPAKNRNPFLFAPLQLQPPSQLEPLVMQMVAQDENDRPASMAVIKDALQRLKDQAAGPAVTSSVFFATTQPSPAGQPTKPAVKPPVDSAFFASTQLSPQPRAAPAPLASAEIWGQDSIPVPLPYSPSAPLSTRKARWSATSPGVIFVIVASWVIWIIVACFNYKSVGSFVGLSYNQIDSWTPLILIGISSAVLFFFWPCFLGLTAEDEGGDDIYLSGVLGVIAIVCASDICAAIHIGNYPTWDTAATIITFTIGLIIGLLPSALLLIPAIIVAGIFSGLGGLIGKWLS